MSLIGSILRWTVEIDQIDVVTEVSLLASFMTHPREGHLEALLHIMAYLHDKHNSRMLFDPTSYPDIDYKAFWK